MRKLYPDQKKKQKKKNYQGHMNEHFSVIMGRKNINNNKKNPKKSQSEIRTLNLCEQRKTTCALNENTNET